MSPYSGSDWYTAAGIYTVLYAALCAPFWNMQVIDNA
jgi:hypothetical protein